MTIPELFTKPTVQDRAAASYASMVENLDSYARDLADAGKPVTAAIARHQAAIAHRAMRAEAIHPDDTDPKWCECSACWTYLCRAET